MDKILKMSSRDIQESVIFADEMTRDIADEMGEEMPNGLTAFGKAKCRELGIDISTAALESAVVDRMIATELSR